MEIADRLKAIVGQENVVTGQADCLGYSRDMSVHFGVPDAVVFADTTEQVSEIMKLCSETKTPVIPRGGGTSVIGAVLPMTGGILLNLIRMNKILETNLVDQYVKVEPGIVCATLNGALAPQNYFFPPDPGSAAVATIGGMINTNASGIRAMKYGTTGDFVMGLKVVMADGRVLETGTIAPKSSSGYDLTALFGRSEGTLGVITEATLRILPKPHYSISSRLEFPDIASAGAAVTEAITSGIPISTCEIMDNVSIDVLKKSINLQVPDNVGCLIMMEIDGHKEAVLQSKDQVDEIAKKHGMSAGHWTDNPEEVAPLWEGRHRLVPAMSRLKKGYRLVPLAEDFGVPLSKIPDTIAEIQKIGDKYGFPIATFGHIGDGNLHATFIMDVKNKDEWEAVKNIAMELIDTTAEMEGTVSAEHGVGMAKAPYIEREVGALGLELMQKIKDALDPDNILNPGKMGLKGSITDITERSGFESLRLSDDDVESFGEVDDEIVACIQCGFCRLGCPTYAQTDLESMNARGRVSLAFHMLTGRIQPNEDIADRLYRCMLCLNCKYTCPAQVDVAAIVQAARKRIVRDGYLPEVFKKLMADMIDKGNPFAQPKETRADSYPDSFTAKDKAQTMLHLGCSASYNDVKIIPATMKILDKAGIDYTALGEEEVCCGYLAYLVGDMETFHKVAEINNQKFKAAGSEVVLTTCAGCHKTFEELYPKEGHGDSYRPEHIVETMERLIEEGKLSFKEPKKEMKVIYHDPCDLGRHLGIYEPPRNVINALPGVELVEFPLNRQFAKCCGGGGGVKAFAGELGADIALERVKQALATGADTLVSACPSCKNSLNQAAARARKEKLGKIKVMDITELVAKNLVK